MGRNPHSGHSSLDHPGVRTRPAQFISHVSNNAAVRQQFVTDDSGNKIEIDDDIWLTLTDRSLLFFAILTSGQPSCASELVRLTYANPGHSFTRELTFANRRFVSMILNLKAAQRSCSHKGIPRFPAQPMSDLLLKYLVYVRTLPLYLARRLDMPGVDALRCLSLQHAGLRRSLDWRDPARSF